MESIIYLRVSTTGQVEEGVSLEAQEAKARSWCLLNDYPIKGVFTDSGISGKSCLNRPGLQNALASCSRGDALVAYSLSRLSRSTRDTLELAEVLSKKGVDLVSLTERIDTTSASGKMIFRMLSVLGEFERDQTVERTIAALRYKKSMGERTGTIPYGSALADDRIHLLPNESEAGLVKAAKEFKAEGLSLRKIAAKLVDLGYQPRGKKFHAETIKIILARAA